MAGSLATVGIGLVADDGVFTGDGELVGTTAGDGAEADGTVTDREPTTISVAGRVEGVGIGAGKYEVAGNGMDADADVFIGDGELVGTTAGDGAEAGGMVAGGEPTTVSIAGRFAAVGIGAGE